jgi:hypothetical protein
LNRDTTPAAVTALADTLTVHIRKWEVFTLASLRERLSLRKHTLLREIRLRRLRYSKRSGKVFILGRWVRDWLAAGEVVREPSATEPSNGKAT